LICSIFTSLPNYFIHLIYFIYSFLCFIIIIIIIIINFSANAVYTVYTHTQFISVQPNSTYPDRLGPSVKFVENSTKLTCLEITVYRIKYSTVLWLLELQIRRGRKV